MQYDVVIVGAGVAGLTALSELSRAGLKAVCLEATDRIGGRILTIHDRDFALPVELGAEFIHGRPPATWDLVHRENLPVFQHSTEAVHIEAGHVANRQQTGEPAEKLLSHLRTRKRDQTLRESLEHSSFSAATKKWAVVHIEGFNAAHQERASLAALKSEAHAADEIEGDHAFRILKGYDSIPSVLARENAILRNHVVQRVQWRPGNVRLAVHSTLDGRRFLLSCSRVIMTVPLGVLQAGSITFAPEPAPILRAARSLEVGHVFRVVFRFPDTFWADRFPATSFFVSTETVFPAWWTPFPVITPILTGWSAGPAADPLQGKTREAIIKEALASLSRILARDIPPPIAAHFHDWSADPFFRGAYSYVPVNALAARRSLARPVKNTLFFAGEATNTEGHGGTVHGAIATGLRAAKQILRATRSL